MYRVVEIAIMKKLQTRVFGDRWDSCSDKVTDLMAEVDGGGQVEGEMPVIRVHKQRHCRL